MRLGDVITSVEGVTVHDFNQLTSMTLPINETIPVQFLSEGETKTIQVETIQNPNNSSKGALGFYGATYYPPYLSVPTMPSWLFSFLLWLSYFSALVGAFNMLPMVPFDGEGYMTSFLERHLSANSVKYVRYSVNILILALFAGNLVASLFRAGFRPF
jgi:membrane-associated protease RseP (regulator of RpoE activity)